MCRYIHIVLSSILCFTMSSWAEMGCIDNSEHLKKSGDTKEYHYVSCNCPCQRYPQIADRNKCTKCNHFHDIKPYIIISNVDHLNP